MDTLAQLRESLADRYAIEREIGAGGMATVYLARDLRHDRPVALKLLNPELGAVLGVERFLAEIKVTANLQHPNLLPLFDSGAAQGHLFYVMPFVEGESLRARLDREKQLPIDDALRMAIAIANALDYAHGHGVIHRDLKPENILLQAGQPVVADFGIALAVSKAGGSRITQTGLSLGTPQYMSPEQATGDRVIDGRSDIYSLAAMTYEMLTGEPPHIGTTAQAIIARVLTDRPRPVRQTRSAVPEYVELAVDRALQKLPADRFATAREFAEALQGRGQAVTTATTVAMATARRGAGWRARLRDPLLLGLGAVTLAALGFAASLARRPAAADTTPTIRFLYAGLDSAGITRNFPWPAAISDDGRLLVFAAQESPEAAVSFFLKRSDQLEARPIPGTANGSQPVFSPDGEWLAFEADNKERKVRLDGSAPVTIAAGGANNGADWTVDNELLLGSTGKRRGLSRVSTAGGEPVALTTPDSARGELDHLWPVAFPDGKHVAFTIWSGTLSTARLAIASLADGRVFPLDLPGVRPLAVLDGALVYLQLDGAVLSVPLDRSRRKVAGRPVPVHDPVAVSTANNGNSDIHISRRGGLVVGVSTFLSQLTWIDRDGRQQAAGAELRGFGAVRLAPDGNRVAALVQERGGGDIWIKDLRSGTLSRLTNLGSANSVSWTPDGTGVVYTAAGASSRTGIWRQQVEQAASPTLLAEVPQLVVTAELSPDGRSVVGQTLGEGGWRILRAALDSGSAPSQFGRESADEFEPRFSPDGRWVSYMSLASGNPEVFVRSYPDAGVQVQVSAGGGRLPSWSADGSRVYYLSLAGTSLLAARLGFSPGVQVVSRDTLFRSGGIGLPAFTLGAGGGYDVTRDGQRLLFTRRLSAGFRLAVTPNWIAEFRERMAASRR